jgi:hypothetical protein
VTPIFSKRLAKCVLAGLRLTSSELDAGDSEPFSKRATQKRASAAVSPYRLRIKPADIVFGCSGS